MSMVGFTKKRAPEGPGEQDNPLQTALDNYLEMERQLMVTRDELAHFQERSLALENENDRLKTELEAVKKERSYLQAYCVNVTTRLDVIQESIAAAKSEALKFSVRQGPSPHQAEDSPDGDGAEDLIRRISDLSGPSGPGQG